MWSEFFCRVYSHYIYSSGGKVCKGESRLFYDLSPDHTHVAVVGLGSSASDLAAEEEEEGEAEDIDVAAQNVRSAAAIGTKLLQGAKVKSVLLDDFSNAEGMYVRRWMYCKSCTVDHL